MNNSGQKLISLANIRRGAVIEMFDEQMNKVLENISDPNTAATAKRTITIKFTVAPDESRRTGTITIDCSAKLAGMSPQKTFIDIGTHNGVPVAVEMKQSGDLFPKPEDIVNTKNFNLKEIK